MSSWFERLTAMPVSTLGSSANKVCWGGWVRVQASSTPSSLIMTEKGRTAMALARYEIFVKLIKAEKQVENLQEQLKAYPLDTEEELNWYVRATDKLIGA